MRVLLFGRGADAIRPLAGRQPGLELVERDPEAVVCYGGDGTLLTAELEWPGLPKIPIRNSRKGNRCIPHPPGDVLERLAQGRLARTEFVKLACTVCPPDQPGGAQTLQAMNEANVHMGRINAAVRLKLWINGEPYAEGQELIGDGLVIATPFGSTAYFNQITRGVFYTGLGIALKNTPEHTSHVIVPDDSTVRVRITRGPALLAYDNSPRFIALEEGHEIRAQKHPEPATLYTWAPMSHPSDAF